MRTIVPLALLTALMPLPAAAQQPAGPTAPAGWAAAVKDARRVEGLFTLFLKPDNTLLVSIRPEQLDHEFGMMQDVVRAPQEVDDRGDRLVFDADAVGGVALIEFHRVGDRVELRRLNTRFTAAPGSTLWTALPSVTPAAGLALLKIVGTDSATGAVLVDLTPFLLSDYPNFAALIKDAYDGTTATFDPDRSYVDSAAASPRAAAVDVELRYHATDVPATGVYTVTDKRFIPLRLRTTVFALPDVPMRPRLGDDRVGYFLVSKWDYARFRDPSPYRDYIVRWRLEPGERVGDKYRPRNQIVYWIDRTVPRELRPYVREGVLAWNRAFEAAGWVDVLAVREAPDSDPTWNDLDHNVIRWVPSAFSSAWGGPSVDPRTGEILRAQIDIHSADNSPRLYAMWIATAPPSLRQAREEEDSRCRAGALMNADLAELRLSLVASGELAPDAPLPAEVEGQAVTQHIMHEVGHTLGLRHNFKASSSIPYDSLMDTSYVRRRGISRSVMDYLPPRLAPERHPQPPYFMSQVGDYDIWAIEYGYSRTDTSGAAASAVSAWTPDSDHAALEPLLRESVRPEYAYGTDGDAQDPRPQTEPWAVDPASSAFDLGDDEVRYVRDHFSQWRHLYTEIDRRVLRDSIGYDQLRSTVRGGVLGSEEYLFNVVKNIGGSYVSRSHYHDPGAPPPFTPVPASTQRAALALVLQEAYARGAFALPPHLLNELLPSRMGRSEDPDVEHPLDPPIHEWILGVQRDVLASLLHPARLERLFDTELRVEPPSDAFTVSELLQTLSRSLFAEIWSGPPRTPIDGLRRDVQTVYIEELARLVLDSPTWSAPEGGVTRQLHAPLQARALARLELVELDGRIGRALAGHLTRDDKAHLLAARDAIRRTLTASIATPAGDGARQH
jgi:hypothetical protein